MESIGIMREEEVRLRKGHLTLLVLCIAVLTLSGCAMFTRTVYVPDGKAVKLRQDVKNVKIWVKDKNGVSVEGKMTLHEGWMVLPMPEDKQ